VRKKEDSKENPFDELSEGPLEDDRRRCGGGKRTTGQQESYQESGVGRQRKTCNEKECQSLESRACNTCFDTRDVCERKKASKAL
jgi:hypothetical protein